jgi:dTDP-4-amino-4,6-dideoxygalactose transaminase
MSLSTQSELALNTGKPTVTIPAPQWPQVGEEEVAWMEGVVRSGQWSWYGPHEAEFSSEFADLCGAKYCMLMSNGTVTIQCALQGVGVKPGDEVIVPGLTWCATAQAALDIGANVVLVDIDPETYCIDPKTIEAAITEKTTAIVPVHLYGCMCDMDAIMDIARRHNLKVVEDVAHQHGGVWRLTTPEGTADRVAGAIGDAGSFSFQQSKVLTCGEGGAVVCSDEEVYNVIHSLKHVGWLPDRATPGNHYGHNYRGTEMQAVLLRGGLRRLPEHLVQRDASALYLAAELDKMGGPLRAAKRDPRVVRQSYYAMTLHFDAGKAAGLTRDQYTRALAAEGCPFGGTYWPVYQSPLLNLYDWTSPIPYRDPQAVQNYAALNLPVTERVCGEEGVTLMHMHLLGSRDYLAQLLAAVRKVNERLDEVKAYFDRQG